MSTANINKEFTDFGNRINIIAILTLLSLILGILGVFSSIFTIISFVLDFIIIIFFLLVLGNLKRAGRELNNNELLAFTPKFLFGTVIRFVGQVLWTIGWFSIGDLWIFAVIGALLILVGSILRYMAWNGLQMFFETNSQLFPSHISFTSLKGAKYCKIATILGMTLILTFIGEILRIIGFFKLASTKNLASGPVQPIYHPATPQPTTAPVSSVPTPRFCPSCGSSIVSGAKFCPNCGSEIN